MRKLLGVLGVVTLLACLPAFGTAVIDFGTGNAGAGGTITATSGGNFTGSAIPVDALTVCNPTCTTYDLSGTATSTNQDANLSASLDFNTTTGAFAITGDVTALGITSDVVLLSGTISGFSVICPTGGVTCLITFNPATDTKNPDLLSAIGLPGTNWQMSGFTTGFNLLGGSPYTAISTDITNTQVPEPASLMLLGAGFLGLGTVARKRVR